jgi:hypothetical protein
MRRQPASASVMTTDPAPDRHRGSAFSTPFTSELLGYFGYVVKFLNRRRSVSKLTVRPRSVVESPLPASSESLPAFGGSDEQRLAES